MKLILIIYYQAGGRTISEFNGNRWAVHSAGSRFPL